MLAQPRPDRSRPARPVPPTPPRPLLDARRAAALRIAIGSKAARASSRMLDRATFGWTAFDQEEIDRLGSAAWLERQLDPASIDDFGLDEALEEALPSLTMSPFERVVGYEGAEEVLYYELAIATLYRAIYSPRQLFERMVAFWGDHLHVSIHSDASIWLKSTDDREVIRRHALGTVRGLLRASLRSPAMLSYLTNDSNVAGRPNENYARELLELHTLGVGGGYTERDVKELARCLTGWGFHPFESGPDGGRFAISPEHHDPGEKIVLGLRVAAQPHPTAATVEAEVDRVIDHLLEHPSTARFVATKMLRHVWGESPRAEDIAEDIDAVAAVYAATGGEIAAMVRECLRPERLARAPTKLKRPFHFVASAVRALAGELEDPFPALDALDRAGHLPFAWGPPNGYPDVAAHWAGLLLPRWNWATRLTLDPEVGVRLPPELDQALTRPTEWVDRADELLTGGRLDRESRRTLHRAATWTARRIGPAGLRQVLGLALSTPAFQSY